MTKLTTTLSKLTSMIHSEPFQDQCNLSNFVDKLQFYPYNRILVTK